MQNINFKGVVKSKPDPRDYLYSKIAAPISAGTLPIKFKLPMPTGYIFNNQASRGTCVGQSGAFTKEFLDTKERGNWVDYSADYLWDICKLLDGAPEEEGTDLRTACKVITQYGICEEKLMPYRLTPYTPYWPSQSIINAAIPNRILSYARVTTQLEFKQALYEQQIPIFFGIIITDNYNQITNGYWPMPQGTILGGHAMAIVGWDDEKRVYIVVNSWGTGAPTDNGYVYIPYDYMHGSTDIFPYLLDAFTFIDYIDPNSEALRKQNELNALPSVLYPAKMIINMTINGEVIDKTQYPSYIINDRTYVPLRLVSEKLGAIVNWEQISDIEGKITITK